MSVEFIGRHFDHQGALGLEMWQEIAFKASHVGTPKERVQGGGIRVTRSIYFPGVLYADFLTKGYDILPGNKPITLSR